MHAQPYEIDDGRHNKPYIGGASTRSAGYNFTSPSHRGGARAAASPSSAAVSVMSMIPSTLDDLLILDTVAVRQAEDRQIVEEHYLLEMKRAVGQADKADSDCDDARRRLKQLKGIMEAVQHKRDSTAAIVTDYKSRLESMMEKVNENKSAIDVISATKEKVAAEAEAQEAERQKRVEAYVGTIGGGSEMSALEALRYDAECEERRVMSLRQRHLDSHQLAKDVRTDLELLRDKLRKAENRRAELETIKLKLTALEANAGFRDATTAFNSYNSLMEKVQWQQKEISATRIEGQSMVMHLIEGSKKRSDSLAKERSRVIEQYRNKFGLLKPETDETLKSLFAVNAKRRSEFVSMIVTSAAEKEAMEQYIGVLSERCGGLLRELRELERQPTVPA